MDEYKIPEKYQRLQLAASKDETRFNIRGVRFRDGFAIATDGHLLATIKYAPGEATDLPVGKTIQFTLPEPKSAEVTEVYCSDCDEFLDVPDEPPPDTSFTQVTDKLLASDTHVAHVIDGDFPAVSSEVLPKHKQPVRFCFNPFLLARLAEAWDTNSIILEVESAEGGELKPILVVPAKYCQPNRDCVGAIMPMRLDGGPPSVADIREGVIPDAELDVAKKPEGE